MFARCNNEECPETGIEKAMPIAIGEHEPVTCGHCYHPTVLIDDNGAVIARSLVVPIDAPISEV